MAAATGISCDINERIESVNIIVESSNDLTLSQEHNERKRNSKKTLKQTINGGLHKINKVISNYLNEYGQPYYDN